MRIDDMNVGEVYYLKDRDCYSLIVDIGINPHDGDKWIYTRLSPMKSPSPFDQYMGLTELKDILIMVTVDGENIMFASDNIRNFSEYEVSTRFPESPSYTLSGEELERVMVTLAGPKCPLSGKRCTVCKGSHKLPNADKFMIIEQDGQGRD